MYGLRGNRRIVANYHLDMDSLVTISTASEGDTEQLVISGEVDVVSAGVVEEALMAAIGKAGSSVVADLAGVSFMDSSGLRAFIVAREQAESSGVSLRLESPQPIVERVLRVTGVAESFGIGAR